MGCGANKGYEIPSNDERDGDDVTEERHSSSEAVQNMRLLTVACDPLRILFIRVKFKSMILFALLTVYVAITLVFFFRLSSLPSSKAQRVKCLQWIQPSMCILQIQYERVAMNLGCCTPFFHFQTTYGLQFLYH